mgnify:CR=1 FL=1
MAKKKDEAPVKTDGWKDTFSDLMNLLLCFFVLLFASSTIDAEKFQEIAQSMAQSFSILNGGQTGIGQGVLIASGASQLTQLSEYYTELGKNEDGESDSVTYAKLELEKEQLKESTKMSENIERELENKGISSSVEVQTALSQRWYGKIFIMVGVNELGDKTPEEYAQAYANNIERIRELQPDASIFIMGMMHVTTGYSDASDVFNNDNIDNRNTAAAGLADGEMVFYLDMNECVGDECGGVREEYSYDGVHLKAEYYKLWTEWMKAHGINKLIK